MLLAALLFSTGGAAIKACSLPGWQVASLRSAIAAATLLLILPEARGRWSGRAVAVGAAYAATMVLYVLANKLTTAASTIFLQSTAPLWVVLLGPWLLAERLRGRDLGFMVVLALGMALFFAGAGPPTATAPDPARGDVLAALSGVTWALTILGLRWLATGPDGGGVFGPALICGNLLAFAAGVVAAPPFAWPSAVDGLVLGYLGACQVGLAYLFLGRGVRRVPAVEAALLLLVEPVLNALWAWMLHGEAPGPLPIAGGAIVLAATAARTVGEARRLRARVAA